MNGRIKSTIVTMADVRALTAYLCVEPGFSTFFYHVPQFFGQEGDVPTIKILPKNTKYMHVYYDFSTASAQVSMSICL